MGSVIFETSMSLDGFMAAENVRPEAGLGDDGERLHDWVFRDEFGKDLLAREVAELGAVICGRRTYDLSIPWWGADGPTGSARVPVFVLSHSVPDAIPEGGVYTFEHDPETALADAVATAGAKNVSVMGGAQVAQHYLRAALVDEIWIHLVPVLFGSGIRVFGDLDDGHVTLETVEVMQSEHATHLHLRVARPG